MGYGGLAPDYRRHALILGPLALGNLRAYTATQPLPGRSGKRYGAYEVIAIVSAGADPVLSLPRSEWSSKFRSNGLYRLRDLDQVVHFKACVSPRFNHGVSQFDGGFVVTRPQCVRVLVTGARRTYRGEFPAAASCPR